MSKGNDKTYGNKGNNHPYQFNVLRALGEIIAVNTPPAGGLATEATAISILNAIVASDQDIEILLVRDQAPGNGNPVVKQVTNYQTGIPVISYENVDGTSYVPSPNPPDYVYLDPSAVLNLMLAELIGQGLTLDSIETLITTIDTVLDAIKLDTANLDVALSTRASEATLLSTNTLLTIIDAVLDTIKTDTGNMLTSLATEATLLDVETAIDAVKLDTAAMVIDLAAIEVLITSANALLTLMASDLAGINTEIQLTNIELGNIKVDTGNIATDTSTLATPVTGLGISLLRVTATGAASVPAGRRRITFANVGNTDAQVAGTTLARGEVVTFAAGNSRDTLSAISYNALTSTLLISTVG